MARNKYPEVTVNRILDVSLKLFLEKGYEKTTIQDIVNSLGDLSKGAIYHHFKSKEDIINAVTKRMCEQRNIFETVKKDELLNGKQKIKEVFVRSITDKEQREIYRLSPSLMDNPKFLSKQLKQAISVSAPLLKEMLREAVEDGSLEVKYTKELSEVVILLMNIWLNPTVFVVSKDEFENKIKFLSNMLKAVGLDIIDEKVSKKLREFHEYTQRE